MPSSAPASAGTANIKVAYQYVFSMIQPDIKFTIDSIQVIFNENVAYATSTSKGKSLVKATGNNIPEINREMFVFKKEEESWRISKYMFNKMSQ